MGRGRAGLLACIMSPAASRGPEIVRGLSLAAMRFGVPRSFQCVADNRAAPNNLMITGSLTTGYTAMFTVGVAV